LNLRRTSRSIVVVGALLPVLLLFGCGHSKVASASGLSATTTSTTPPTTLTGAPPPTEGTGPGPTLAPSNGVSVSVASLPIGVVGETAGPGGTDACLSVHYFGSLVSGVVLAVSRVVVDAPLRSLGADITGCPSASSSPPQPCVGDQLRVSDNGDALCYARVAWSGTPPSSGALELTGVLRCSGLDASTCQRVADGVSALADQSGPASFDLTSLSSPSGTDATTSTSTPIAPPSASTAGAAGGSPPSIPGSP
jgi:hypothetical protein